MSRPRPVLLLILDGWGHREEREGNAIAQAEAPNWRRLWADCPHALVHTSGRHVGLPDGQMGNSEVGHMTLGAGRVIYQDLTRIDLAIEDGSFFGNEALRAACASVAPGGTLHLMGLVSPGGVHSHERHLLAMLELARREGVARVAVHAFLDGRDTPPRSAAPSLARLQAACDEAGARIASVSGRYFAMDRDRRWDRVERAWNAIVEARSPFAADSAGAALEAAYARGEDDEFVQPTVIAGGAPVADGDAVVFINFRADRARQLSAAFVDPAFDGFGARRPKLASFTGMAEYQDTLPMAVAFASESPRDTLPEVVATAGMAQLRIAETEKYAHVTFFFNGGREQALPGEERILVPSPKVATYDLKPEMSCPEVTEKLCAAIRSGRFDLVVCNIANPDMVGHTGRLEAAIQAVEVVDRALGDIVAALRDAGGEMLLTADHGNLEQMIDPEGGGAHTAHTTGPVPLVYFGRPARLREDGGLRDIAPSVLALMGLPKPAAMSGESLVVLEDGGARDAG